MIHHFWLYILNVLIMLMLRMMKNFLYHCMYIQLTITWILFLCNSISPITSEVIPMSTNVNILFWDIIAYIFLYHTIITCGPREIEID